MAGKQRNERVSTRYEGVYRRESRTRRNKGKPDVCYSIDYYDPETGRRVRKTIGWESQEISAKYAKAVRENLLSAGQKRKLGDAAPFEPELVPTLGKAWEMYRRDWLEGQGKKSLGADDSRFKLLASLASTPLHRITGRDLENFSAALQRRGYSAQTCKHVLALVRRIMNKAIAWKLWRGPTPFAEVKLPRVNNERQRYLTPFEAACLLEALAGINRRCWLMSLISLHCGLRFGEIAALRRADLDFDADTIFIRDPKSGRDRFAMMTDTIKAELSTMAASPPSKLLFPTLAGTVLKEVDDDFTRVVDALEFNTGVADARQKVVFHTLRHTFASWLAKSGSGQSAIADMLGHHSLQMSKRYTHLMPDSRREAANAVNDLFKNGGHSDPRSS